MSIIVVVVDFTKGNVITDILNTRYTTNCITNFLLKYFSCKRKFVSEQLTRLRVVSGDPHKVGLSIRPAMSSLSSCSSLFSSYSFDKFQLLGRYVIQLKKLTNLSLF